MNNRRQLWIVIPFMIIIYSIGIVNFIDKDRAESTTENRTLQQKPGIENIISKDYPGLYESYYTDQFVGRDELLKLYTEFEMAAKKSTVRGYYIVDKWIMPEPTVKQEDEVIEASANKLNKFAKKISNDSRDIFYVSTPSKSIALNHLYPKYAPKDYGMENLNKFINLLDTNAIDSINIDEKFQQDYSSKELESFYFKTDHHWNGYGAFKGFKHIIKGTNYLGEDEYNELFNDENYTRYDEKNKPFLGSYNRNLFYLFDQNEEIPYVYSTQTQKYEVFSNDGMEYTPIEIDKVIAPEKAFNQTTYGGAYTYDLPLYKVVNKDAPIKKKLLIVRDSYQAPTTLMFADLFETVEVLDPRNSLGITCSSAIGGSNPDIVMFMFNSSTFSTMVDLVN